MKLANVLLEQALFNSLNGFQMYFTLLKLLVLGLGTGIPVAKSMYGKYLLAAQIEQNVTDYPSKQKHVFCIYFFFEKLILSYLDTFHHITLVINCSFQGCRQEYSAEPS